MQSLEHVLHRRRAHIDGGAWRVVRLLLDVVILAWRRRPVSHHQREIGRWMAPFVARGDAVRRGAGRSILGGGWRVADGSSSI